MSKIVTAQRLVGKVAVVTAATMGIGYATAERLAQEGANVMISSRKQHNVDKAVNELRSRGHDVRGMVCHVGKADHRKSLMEETSKQFGGIDILVSNAGITLGSENILESTEAEWDKTFDINVKSTFFLISDAAPFLAKRGGGSIIIMSSVMGYHSYPLKSIYSISKTALIGVVKNTAPQLAEMNIRINGLAPGYVKTKLSDYVLSNEDLAQKVISSILVKRFAQAEEMASVAAFLASDDASYVTAETIVAAGGMTSHL